MLWGVQSVLYFVLPYFIKGAKFALYYFIEVQNNEWKEL